MATPTRNIVLSVCFLLLSLAAQGSNAACTNQELTTIFTCITPYNQQFFDAIGVDSNVCNRSLITGELCTSFATIVTCVNGKDVSDETCRPGASAQINTNMQIPCKIEDFEAVCTNAPAINRGGASDRKGCTTQELGTLFTCIEPYNVQFFQAIGVDSDTCIRTRITSDLCTNFTEIVKCVNGKDVSDVTCRPYAIGQINPLMRIPCKVGDFEAVCTSSPKINKGDDTSDGSGSTTLAVAFPLLIVAFIAAVTSLGGR